MVEVQYGESSGTFFRHPLSGEQILVTEAATPIEKLRLLCNPELLPDFSRDMFLALFPSDMELKPDFNLQSTQPYKEAMLTTNEKNIRSTVLSDVFGYTTPRKAKWKDTSFLPHLHVAYTDNPDAFVNQFNTLPTIQRLKDIWQTSLDDRGRRWDHTQHLMHWGVLDMLRYGLHQPELFLEKYEQDMKIYGAKYKESSGEEAVFSLEPTDEEREKMIEVFSENGEEIKGEAEERKIRAACVAVSYAKYLLISMGFHDAETPGWCDIFMKAAGSGALQGQDYFSEDDALAQNFGRMLVQDKKNLARLVEQHKLDPRLLITLVQSVASENDVCLPGLMYKDKRKGLGGDARFSHMATGSTLDLDQLSGVVTNMEIIADTYLPGGFNPHITNGKDHPLFSFEARMMVLYYAMLSRLPKEQLGESLRVLGIDPARMYIAAEEITYGQSVMFQKVQFGEKEEIVPVPMVPGDVKRGYLAFMMLYTGFYLHPNKETVVAILKNMVTEWLENRPERSYDFLHRSLSETNRLFQERNPVMAFFEGFDQGQAAILSEREVHTMVQQDPDGLRLVKKIRMGSPYPEKPGTLTMTQSGEVAFALEVLKRRIGEHELNPHSLPSRAEKLRQGYSANDVCMVIQLTDEDVTSLSTVMDRMLAEDRVRMVKVFDAWTRESIGGMEFTALRNVLVDPYLL